MPGIGSYLGRPYNGRPEGGPQPRTHGARPEPLVLLTSRPAGGPQLPQRQPGGGHHTPTEASVHTPASPHSTGGAGDSAQDWVGERCPHSGSTWCRRWPPVRPVRAPTSTRLNSPTPPHGPRSSGSGHSVGSQLPGLAAYGPKRPRRAKERGSATLGLRAQNIGGDSARAWGHRRSDSTYGNATSLAVRRNPVPRLPPH